MPILIFCEGIWCPERITQDSGGIIRFLGEGVSAQNVERFVCYFSNYLLCTIAPLPSDNARLVSILRPRFCGVCIWPSRILLLFIIAVCCALTESQILYMTLC